MRVSICAAIVASLLGIPECLAAPSFKSSLFRVTDTSAKDVEAEGRDEGKFKYFSEPGNDNNLGHYDSRYFHGLVDDAERMDTQSHLMRAYLTFFNERKLDTWIAHGTLLGWWWNGKRLPWDYDLDTQVPHGTLQRLGREFNQTRYQYTSADSTTSREYLLDVNPWSRERNHGDGLNIIDARWIDVRNGLYIDITGLSEQDPETRPGVVSCKNYHYYKMEDLYPMRETMFEGMWTKVPYAYDTILIQEYHEKALVNTDYNGYVWDAIKKEWVKSAETLEMEEKENRKQKDGEEMQMAFEQGKLD